MTSHDEKAVGFSEVWRDELDEIESSREARLGEDIVDFGLGEPIDRAKRAGLAGLAFSGGGIRSATFNLGVLQALARTGILRKIDYLSTVSGGGYIGSWLAAWIKREGFEKVTKKLSENSSDPLSPDLEPISFLRDYSNYLTPQKGFFSADLWTMAMIWCRNTLLNQVILIAFLSFLLLLPRWLKAFLDLLRDQQAGALSLVISALFFLLAAWFIAKPLSAFDCSEKDKQRAAPPGRIPRWRQQPGIQWRVVIPLLVGAWLAAGGLWACLWNNTALGLQPVAGAAAGFLFVLLILVSVKSGFVSCYRSRHRNSKLAPFIGPALIGCISAGCAAAAFAPLYGLAFLIRGWAVESEAGEWHVVAWGGSLLLIILSLVIVLQIGWMSRNMPDDRREWWSRLGAWIGLYSIAAGLLAAIAIYGPLLVAMIWRRASLTTILGSGWFGTTVASIFAAKSNSTSAKPGEKRSGSQWMEKLATIGPYVFIAGLLLILSTGIHLGLVVAQNRIWRIPDSAAVRRCEPCGCSVKMADLSSTGLSGPLLECLHYPLLSFPSPGLLALLTLVILGTLWLFSSTIDINEFSLHHFYRNRLIRCYLGASHPMRWPDPFTGFDRDDDLRLTSFLRDEPNPYEGPYPILNTAFNFNHGARLAWQERQAASFIFTPQYCGYESFGKRPGGQPDKHLDDEGYRPTAEYGYPGGIHIGTAMAISGAAASPNMGYHTSAPVAFLLTLFNVRLGWWLGNPRRKATWRKAGPRFGILYLLAELFALTNAESEHIYLSDGGHFENLGIYELARRHCRLIIACDAEQDGDLAFGGLGSAIRKCRTDLGIQIDIDVSRIATRDPDGRSETHFAIGDIIYPEPGYPPGKLIYLKASLVKDQEPTDALEYRSREKRFPHQSTADQFFDESQFESYRVLGEHIATASSALIAAHI